MQCLESLVYVAIRNISLESLDFLKCNLHWLMLFASFASSLGCLCFFREGINNFYSKLIIAPAFKPGYWISEDLALATSDLAKADVVLLFIP